LIAKDSFRKIESIESKTILFALIATTDSGEHLGCNKWFRGSC